VGPGFFRGMQPVAVPSLGVPAVVGGLLGSNLMMVCMFLRPYAVCCTNGATMTAKAAELSSGCMT
jgi:hypothetical protein